MNTNGHIAPTRLHTDLTIDGTEPICRPGRAVVPSHPCLTVLHVDGEVATLTDMTDASRMRHQMTIGREDRSVTVVEEWTLLLRFPLDRADNAALKKVTRGRARWDGRRKGYTLVIGSTGLAPEVCALVEKLAAKHVLSVTREVRLLVAGNRPGRITPEMLEEPKPEPLRPMPPPPPPPPPPRSVEQLLRVTGAIYWTNDGYFCAMCDSNVGGGDGSLVVTYEVGGQSEVPRTFRTASPSRLGMS